MTPGQSLALDISTLYLVATMVAILLGGLLLYFWRQERIPALAWWGLAYALGGAAIGLWTVTSRRYPRWIAKKKRSCGCALASESRTS